MLDTSTQTSGDHVQAVDISDGPSELLRLHEQVLARNGRVELVRAAANDGAATVLISKRELDSLERALEILSATDDVRAMRNELAKLVLRSGEPMLSVFGRDPGDGGGDSPRLHL